MNQNLRIATILLALAVLPGFQLFSTAQNTSFTYQGRLNDGANPANGTYDLRFTVYDTLSGGSVAGGPLTNTAIAVSNGLFTVTLDFGPGVFTGAGRWLELSARTNAGGTFTDLTPRQQITAAPYAIQAANAASAASANSVAAGNISGTIALTQLPGTLLTNNSSVASLSGSFSGNGGGLTNLSVSASQLVGVLADAQLSTNVALRSGGNLFSGSQQVAGVVIAGGPAPDAQQLGKSTGIGGADNWQSFTAGTNGLLTGFSVTADSPNGTNCPGFLYLYAGQSTNGTLLATQSVTWVTGFLPQSNGFSAPVYITVGSQYTVRFGAATASTPGWVNANTSDAYAGGRADFSLSGDYQFQTFVAPAAAGSTILTVNPANSGFVGIGTNVPQAMLHVAGDILANGMISGNGAGLSSLNASNLSIGAVPDARLSTNVAILNRTNVFSATNRFAGVVIATNVNNQMAGAFTGNGAGLTSLNAANLSGSVPAASLTSVPAASLTGSILDARLSVNVPLLNGTNVFTGTNRFAGIMLATNANNQINGAFSGSGAGLSSLNAGSVSSGTLLDARLSPNVVLLNGTQTFSGANTFSNAANNFTGNGAGLTGLTAAAISSGVLDPNRVPDFDAVKLVSGTLGDGRLSANVALRAGGNLFSGSQQVADTVITAVQIVDQQQSVQTASSGSPDQWQSFTAGTNGLLTAVALGVASPLNASPSPGTIRIYSGEGTNGTLLASQAVTWTPAGSLAFQTNALTPAPYLSTGSKYTIRFSAPSVAVAWVEVNSGDPYPLGRSDWDPSIDYLFITFMTPATANSTVLMVNPVGNSGFVGIGTNAPQARLHVAGDILVNGVITGSGAGLTSLNAGNLSSGQLADARLSSNVARLSGNQIFSGANTLSNTANSFSGNGAGLTSLNAGNLSNGTLLDARLSGNVPLLSSNQTFSGANIFSNAANSFTGNGGGLTNLNAANLTGSIPAIALTSIPATNLIGTLTDARLSTNVVLLNGTNVFSGTNRFAGVLLATNLNNQLSGTFVGNGGLLTNLASTNLTGTLADVRLSTNVALLNATQTFSGVLTLSNTVNIASNNFLKFGAGVPGQEVNAGKIGYQTFTPGALDIVGAGTNNTSSRGIRFWAEAGSVFSGPVTATSFSGNGSGLSGLNAASLTTGTMPDGRLSSNVPLLNGTNVFTGTNFFNAGLSIGSVAPLATVEIQAGADSSGAADGKAIALAWHGGGYRHFIRSRHDSASGNGNAIDFFVNNSSSANASSAPGTNNSLVMTLGGSGVGIGRTNPATALDVNGVVTAAGFSGSGVLPWQVVTGITQQAQPNTGYLLTNDSLVTVTLPGSPALGDIVRLTGGGASGWKLAQNASQSVASANLVGNIGSTWTPRDSGRNWYCLASSADGSKFIAGILGGQLYTSIDSGVSWVGHPTTSFQWHSVASSADGSKLVAVGFGIAPYTSTDSGLTWNAGTNSGQNWSCVASSADGLKLVGGVYGGPLYTSIDGGASWTQRESVRQWNSIASSSDGVKLVAVVNGGQIYTSTDSGVTWTPRDSSRAWQSVASSTDGTKLLAGVTGGQLYTSINSGATWTPRDNARGWQCVASSSNGSRLVAIEYGGAVYTSLDSGVTWTASSSYNFSNWMCITSSADGMKVVAGIYGGQLYTATPASVANTTTGTAGYLLGGQYTTLELQYLGNNRFVPVNFTGAIQAF